MKNGEEENCEKKYYNIIIIMRNKKEGIKEM